MYLRFPYRYLSCSQQTLIKGEQRLVDLKDIVLFCPMKYSIMTWSTVTSSYSRNSPMVSAATRSA